MSDGRLAQLAAKDPVYSMHYPLTKETLWWFYDETWSHAHGPYEIEALARKDMYFYCKEIRSNFLSVYARNATTNVLTPVA